jgi:hypothetical protein
MLAGAGSPDGASFAEAPRAGPERYVRCSSRCLSLWQLRETSFSAWGRTNSGTISLPIPRPTKSSVIVTCDLSP